MTKKLKLEQLDWHAALEALGVNPAYLSNSKRAGPCPIEGEGVTRFRFDNSDGRGKWFCSQCKGGDGVRLVALLFGETDAKAIERLHNLNGTGRDADSLVVQPIVLKEPKPVKVVNTSEICERLSKVWKSSKPLNSTYAQRYLEMRVPKLDLAWLSNNIRFVSSLYHKDEATGEVSSLPCMVAKIVDCTGAPITLHRTYLSPDGTKAKVTPDQVKKLMEGKRKLDGDCVHLNKPSMPSRMLIVCEGIETGLALVAATGNRHPVWAAYSATNLEKVKCSRDMFDTVLIAADHDKFNVRQKRRPGEYSAKVLAARLLKEGFKVVLRVPTVEGTDYADVWLERQRNISNQ